MLFHSRDSKLLICLSLPIEACNYPILAPELFSPTRAGPITQQIHYECVPSLQLNSFKKLKLRGSRILKYCMQLWVCIVSLWFDLRKTQTIQVESQDYTNNNCRNTCNSIRNWNNKTPLISSFSGLVLFYDLIDYHCQWVRGQPILWFVFCGLCITCLRYRVYFNKWRRDQIIFSSKLAAGMTHFVKVVDQEQSS